jgi:succinyl-CoA synthetase beta subunit/citryl-CoA synthetase large subunit
MHRLIEHQTKAWLRGRGLPVPFGQAAVSAAEAVALAVAMPSGCVVKALVPTGRRGKGGGVVVAADGEAAGRAAAQMIGTSVNGHAIAQVYVEEKVEIARELYLSFAIAGDQFKLLVSQEGGVDIEQTFAAVPDKVVSAAIDVLAGATRWQAIDLWREAGVRGPLVRALGDITVNLFDAFRAADAVMLEINPLAVDHGGRLSLVGAMMSVDEYALFRQPQWKDIAVARHSQTVNEREQRVRAVNAAVDGGEAQYVELGGDIGLLVGGGGAGLYIHDLIVSMGGEPANHCVTPPTNSNTAKLKAVITAILDNPRLRGLLVGFNFAQMARADIRIEALSEVLRERGPRASSVPIVVRLFGPGEDKARAIAAEFGNITYLPRGTSLQEACRVVIEKAGAAA